jgi:hypothetical protein
MSLEATLGRYEERISVNGKTYTLARPPQGALLALDREWRKKLKNPLRAAAEVAVKTNLRGEALDALWRVAYEQEKEWNRQGLDALLANVDSDAVHIQFLQTVAACYAALWKYHRAEFPTFDEVEQWLEQFDDLTELGEKLAIVLPQNPKKNT